MDCFFVYHSVLCFCFHSTYITTLKHFPLAFFTYDCDFHEGKDYVVFIFRYPVSRYVIKIYYRDGLWSSPEGCLIAREELPTKIKLFLDYENLVGHFCPKVIINISYSIYMRSLSLPEECIIYMRLRWVPCLLMLGSYE